MLQFVTGRAGSGKTEYLRNQLVLGCEGQTKQMLLVPEQYSFESEKAILRMAGARRANTIQVLSFTRLADLVFRTAGGVAGRRLSEGGRRVIMELAIKACQDQLKVYESAARSGKLADVMMNMINEMKLCGITGETLLEAVNKIGKTGLSEKLREIALISRSYEALVAQAYLDARDDLTRLAQQLEDYNFFSGYTVMVDSFDGFTMQEMSVLRQIMRQSEEVVVSLCTDNTPEGGTGLFSPCNRTKARLKRMARENSIRIKPDVELTAGVRYENANIRLLEANLFDSREPQTSQEHDGVYVCQAGNVYEEAEYVAATIRELVMNQGLRYQDITVISRNPELYGNCLNVSMQKREIPCFISMPCPVDAEPVMRFVLNALTAALHGFQLEAVLELLKTGIAGITVEEISALENYSYLWRLKGSEWDKPFFKHPRGFGQKLEAEDIALLDQLNNLRERIVKPIKRLANKIRSADGQEISQAIYELLCDFEVEANLRAYCDRLDAEGEVQLAEKQVRLWELLMDILDQMAAILGKRPIAPAQYEALLREVISGEDISEIPQVLDSVLYGTPEQIRQSGPKVVFIVGAVQGKFPAIPRPSGMLSDAERRFLITDLKLPLTDALQERTLEERYLGYSVVCAPSQRLYVTYPVFQDGEETSPSEIVNAIHQIFPVLEEIRELPPVYFANSTEAAFSAMSAAFTENSGTAAALRAVFSEQPEYAGRMEALKRAANLSTEAVSDKKLLNRQFAKGLNVSPSQVETFYRCPFRYFCQYMVKAKERRTAEVDAMQYGTAMHHLFERVFSTKGEALAELSDGELRQLLDAEIKVYADRNMGGYQTLSSQEQYRMERMARSGTILVRHVSEELKQSKFKPEHIELQLGFGGSADEECDEAAYAPLRIYTPKGNLVTVGGTIDRVDVYKNEQGSFVRVVDYKTGKKKFRIQDVLYGLNMQMLIYLAALVENGEVLPAGVLYTPLANPSVTADYGTERQVIAAEAEKSLKMNGVILSDADIVTAMEEAAEGRFIPVKLKKDGTVGSTASALQAEELLEVLSFAKRLVGAMADELVEGHVEARPMMKDMNSCAFCPYPSVCGREYGDEDVEAETADKDEILEKMRWQQGGDEQDASE